ncbi:hypothetical protein GCM10010185_70610 [Saccharothrix coeruleofusca]|uniref:HTH luxR-type domain-containing protein n=1 Tax=Saccharothrix coeruleofusca TaxID=33919 RepID=A0A918AUD9_9PSEU|nr:hypothetical protein GCM10010185_70610 [Saccharothrix coeruleofusca]
MLEDAVDSEELAEAVRRAVRRCVRAGLSRAEAEECVHEALLALLARPDREGDEAVRRLADRLGEAGRPNLVDHLRRGGREPHAARRPDARPPRGSGDLVTEHALARWLVKAVQDLPPTTRQVCRALAEGRTPEQVATELGLTHRAVRAHLSRARRALRGLAGDAAASLAGDTRRLVRQTAPIALAAIAAGVALAPDHLSQPAHLLSVPITGHQPMPGVPAEPGQRPDPTTPQALPPAPPAPPPTTAPPPVRRTDAATAPVTPSAPVSRPPTTTPTASEPSVPPVLPRVEVEVSGPVATDVEVPPGADTPGVRDSLLCAVLAPVLPASRWCG